jgi:flagellar protein FliO/FliZ
MDLGLYLRFILALGFVLALIGAIAWLARRFGLLGRLAPHTGKSRRLSVVEVMTLDARNRLVLLRRDATEYLILMGPSANLLVEGGIARDRAASADIATETTTPT